VTGSPGSRPQMDQLQSSAALAGIRLNLRPEPFNEVASLAGNCVVSKTCTWDLAFGDRVAALSPVRAGTAPGIRGHQ
jgi:hypothetical protein